MKKILSAALIFSSLLMFSQTTTIWSENFDDTTALPIDWTQETYATDGGWLVDTTSIASSAYFAIPVSNGYVLYTNDDNCSCDKSNDFVALVPFDLVGVDNPFLVFDLFYLAATFSGISETLELRTSINGLDWVVNTTFESSDAWQTISIDLNDFAGGEVQVAFFYSDGGGWLLGAAIDNFLLLNVDSADCDASLSGATVGVNVPAVPAVYGGYSKYISGGSVLPMVTISNELFAPITSFSISYTYDGNTIVENIANTFIGLNQSLPFTFSTAAIIVAGDNEFTFNLTNVNLNNDDNISNNTDITAVMGVVPDANKIIVAEVGTGTWCGWCPRGSVFTDYLTAKYPDNFIGIEIHNADPMVVAEYDAAIGTNISGYPSGLIDRAYFDETNEMSPETFEKAMMERMTEDSDVEISVAADNYAIGGVTVIANVHFGSSLSGTYKAAVILVEDEVVGLGNGWAQNNYYSGGTFGPMGGFETLGAVIPANSISYNHVARAIIGGWAGADSASVANPAAGSDFSWAFNASIDADWDLNKMRAIVILVSSLNGEIVNAGVSEILATSTEEIWVTEEKQFRVFPNPSCDAAFIQLKTKNKTDVLIRIIDGAGKLISEETYFSISNESLVTINTTNLDNGIYSVCVQSNNGIDTQTLVVNK